MATTTNYSWTTPDNTAYVKDGASAIRTLGSSVDTTLYTALGGAYPGLRLVKKQTIGSGVTSVTVTDAFSATYENYKVIVSGGVGSADGYLSVKMASGSTPINTDYYLGRFAIDYPASTTGNANLNNYSSWLYAGYSTADFNTLNLDINMPFLAKKTFITGAYGATTFGAVLTGRHDLATSYNSLNIFRASGTLTGGTIYVYGYGAS